MKDGTMTIAPSILSADFSNLGKEIRRLNFAGADWIHFDIMDGSFVKNITIGPDVIASVRDKSKLPFDTHLMIENPQNYIEQFAKAGSEIITFHYEATLNGSERVWNGKGWEPGKRQSSKANKQKVKEIIRMIKRLGKKVGIAINPATPAECVYPFVEDVYLILVMTVWPGFGGQTFMDEQLKKVENLRKKFGDRINIEVDGGLNDRTSIKARNSGANVIVAGNYVFKNKNIKEAIKKLRVFV